MTEIAVVEGDVATIIRRQRIGLWPAPGHGVLRSEDESTNTIDRGPIFRSARLMPPVDEEIESIGCYAVVEGSAFRIARHGRTFMG